MKHAVLVLLTMFCQYEIHLIEKILWTWVEFWRTGNRHWLQGESHWTHCDGGYTSKKILYNSRYFVIGLQVETLVANYLAFWLIRKNTKKC